MNNYIDEYIISMKNALYELETARRAEYVEEQRDEIAKQNAVAATNLQKYYERADRFTVGVEENLIGWEYYTPEVFETMDICTPSESRVVFMGQNGYKNELEHAMAKLRIGKEYTVSHIEVQNWTSAVYLEEYPDIGFNTVMFKNI